LNHFCDSLNFVVVGISERLHNGWSHSHPAGHCHHCGADPNYSRTKTIVAVWTLVGEIEYVERRSRKILPNLTIFSVEKVS
jgi:hypothetical protein